MAFSLCVMTVICSSGGHRYFRLDGIGDKAVPVRGGMDAAESCGIGHLVSAKRGLGRQLDAGNSHSRAFGFLKVANGVVLVLLYAIALKLCDGKKGQHVATRHRADEHLLRVRAHRVALVFDGCRNSDGLPAIEGRGVIARIRFALKRVRGALPMNRGLVLGHETSNSGTGDNLD